MCRGDYPNTCHIYKAVLTFVFPHTGEKRKVVGQFASVGSDALATELSTCVSLNMLESTHLILLARNDLSNEFSTFSRYPLDPRAETQLQFGEWQLQIDVTSDSEQDYSSMGYTVQLNPDLSSGWSPTVHEQHKQEVGVR